MTNELLPCPQCQCPYGYGIADDIFTCPDCQYEWNANQSSTESNPVVLDSNGNELQNGDAVIIIKDLKVKGAPKAIKVGTKVKNIMPVEGDHNID